MMNITVYEMYFFLWPGKDVVCLSVNLLKSVFDNESNNEHRTKSIMNIKGDMSLSFSFSLSI